MPVLRPAHRQDRPSLSPPQRAREPRPLIDDRSDDRPRGGPHARSHGRPDARSSSGTLDHLRDGEIQTVGRLIVSSNSALLCRVVDGSGVAVTAIYKPIAFERPLYDFPSGTLGHRETAAFVLSDALGLGIVPPTVLRDGPFGEGAVQLWVEPDETVDPIELVETDDPRLRLIALFDAVANNADRKIGHLLPMPSGSILGVDHGICFHVEPKLRTVLWAWRGSPFDAGEMALLARIATALEGPLASELGSLLRPAEVAATAERAARLSESGRFPLPDPDRPAIPWPPY